MATSKPANGADPEHFYLYIAYARRARIFWHGKGDGLILSSPGRRIRQRRDATGAPTSGRNAGAARAAPVRSHSGGKALNPGSARAEPSHQESQPLHDVAAVLVRQLRGPHL